MKKIAISLTMIGALMAGNAHAYGYSWNSLSDGYGHQFHSNCAVANRPNCGGTKTRCGLPQPRAPYPELVRVQDGRKAGSRGVPTPRGG